MREVDRSNYCRNPRDAFADEPIPIGFGQTISAPHMHAVSLEELKNFIKPGSKVLDVGSGSGFLTACFAKMVGPTGKVYGLEVNPDLVQWSRENIRKGNPEVSNAEIVHGDGWKGLPEKSPFEAIHVGAAAAEMPSALVEQLAAGGRMLIPVGPLGGPQQFLLVDKHPDGSVSTNQLFHVSYVPLVRNKK